MAEVADACEEAMDPERLPCGILLEAKTTECGTRHPEGAIFALNTDSTDPLGSASTVQVISLDDETAPMVGVPGGALRRLTHEQRDYLRAIKNTPHRLAILKQAGWLEEASKLKPGDSVLVYTDTLKEAQGHLRYKGLVPNSAGVHFGIELDESCRGQGSSDGTFRRVRYFDCAEDCAVFVSMYCVRRNVQSLPDEQSVVSVEEVLQPQLADLALSAPPIQSPAVLRAPSSSNSSTHLQQMLDAAVARGQPAPPSPPEPELSLQGPGDLPLRLGERVIWLSDEGPQRGTVRWLGQPGELDPAEPKPTAGVEFDNPVGTGTGRYRGRQLFTAEKDHAALMPILGLLKEEDFEKQDEPARESDLERAIAASLADSSDFSVRLPPLGVGSRVEVLKPPRRGVIEWCGLLEHAPDPSRPIAGILMDRPDKMCYTDGTFSGRRVFHAPPHRAFFIYLNKCRPDTSPRPAAATAAAAARPHSSGSSS